jgi:CRP/FNR family transcriptional regulator
MSEFGTPRRPTRRQRKARTADCRHCVLMRSLHTAGLPATTIQQVCDRMWLNHARRRQTLYVEGNGATHLYAIRSGKVKLVKTDSSGNLRVTAILTAGDLFGFEAVFDDAYATGAEALTNCELCLASADRLTELMAEIPRVATDLARYLHVQLSRTRDRQIAVTATGAPAKMAGYLLHSLPADRDETDDERTVACCELTLTDLGGLLGMSPETACRVLSNLKSRGIVETVPAGIRVRDLPRLRRVAGM